MELDWLRKPVLNAKDIADIEKCSLRTAGKIIRDCKVMYGGSIPMRQGITTESYLHYCGYKDDWVTIVAKMEKVQNDEKEHL